MSSHRAEPSEPWSCKFVTPTADRLMEALPEASRPLVAAARSALRGLDGFRESLDWNGIPWRWSFSYRRPRTPGPAAAYLVPDPESPRIAAPLALDHVCSLSIPDLSAVVREGIASGNRVGSALWCEWPLSDQPGAEAIMALIRDNLDRCGELSAVGVAAGTPVGS